MTKFGETHNFMGYDFVRKIEYYLDRQVDGIVYNVRKPDDILLKKYLDKKAEFVEMNMAKIENWKDKRLVYSGDLLDTSEGIVRHGSEKLASLIKNIIFQPAAS